MSSVPEGVLLCWEEERARAFVERVWALDPTFACVIGNTETGKIPGLSAAGAVPALTDYTPAADMELLFYGSCKCIDGVPVTPDGIPTPALITMAAMKATSMPLFVVNGGVRVSPNTPFIDVQGAPGEDIRKGRALKNAKVAFERALLAGRSLAKVSEYLVVGESIAGGTTTALGVLTALGIDAFGKVSSSMPLNPHELKIGVVKEGIKASGLSVEQMRGDPLAAVEAVGDPMIASAAGLIAGAAERVPVLMAGGTQMAAVLAVVSNLRSNVMDNLAIGTTRWITSDPNSDIRRLVSQIGRVPVLAANLDFGGSQYHGLRVYEQGIVKEGVGAGGSAIASMLWSKGEIRGGDFLSEIEASYSRLVSRT